MPIVFHWPLPLTLRGENGPPRDQPVSYLPSLCQCWGLDVEAWHLKPLCKVWTPALSLPHTLVIPGSPASSQTPVWAWASLLLAFAQAVPPTPSTHAAKTQLLPSSQANPPWTDGSRARSAWLRDRAQPGLDQTFSQNVMPVGRPGHVFGPRQQG